MAKQDLATRMSVEDLSFVANRDGKTLPKAVNGELKRCFWNVKSTGVYSIDTEIGSRLAIEYLNYEECNVDDQGILNSIVDDMPRPLTGVEHGFLIMVCFQAKAGRGEAQRISSYWDRAAARRRASG